ncbi:MAG TPA: hypothetical protein VFB43_13800 [Terracidiphilus sp.]|nr:hypothetical protein [Terracidiphilus sp.]
MGTYQQYSEVVAAYGTRLPPPSSQPERTRIGLPLLYAAIGVALGTFTGMGAALASLQQPGMAMTSVHFSFANSHSNSLKLHPIVNAGQQPVIQNHAAQTVVVPAAPAPVQDHAVASPAVQPKVLEASVAAKPAPVQAKPVKMTAAPMQIAAMEPAPVKMAAVHHHVLTGKLSFTPPADLAASTAPAPTTLTVDSSASFNSIPVMASVPAPMSAPISLDSGAKPQVFYSEGDVTVADYNAAGDTIETVDGKTFVVGATVSASTATSWDDYRANVHYRCDQNGHCTLSRNGVIALNARQI